MKNTFLLILVLLLAACSSDDEPKPVALKWMERDSLTLQSLAYELQTKSDGYPVPWDFEDKSTWKGIKVDTVVLDILDRERASDSLALAVVEFTMYLHEPEQKMPHTLKELKHLKKLSIYAVPGAIVYPYSIPKRVKSLIIDRMGSKGDGPIYLTSISSPVLRFDGRIVLDYIEVHGTDMTHFSFGYTYDSMIDLSYNQLSVEILPEMCRTRTPMNLSHNKCRSIKGGWTKWIGVVMNNDDYAHPFFSHPNLRYNGFDNIPEEVKNSEFWWMYGSSFIGNPGH